MNTTTHYQTPTEVNYCCPLLPTQLGLTESNELATYMTVGYTLNVKCHSYLMLDYYPSYFQPYR